MRIVTETMFGVRLDDALALTVRERQTLRRASAIAERARDLLREHYGSVEAEGLDFDTELAGVEHACRDLASKSETRIG